MSGRFNFVRTYAQYGADIRDFEKSPAVSAVLSVVLSKFEYPASSLLGARLTTQWLRAGNAPGNDASLMALIFEMQGGGFVEIVLRKTVGTAFYGGWLEKGNSYRITNEVVNGYRVIDVTKPCGEIRRHVYAGRFGYQPVYDGIPFSQDVACRMRQHVAPNRGCAGLLKEMDYE